MSIKRIAMVGLGDIAQKAYLPVVANHSDIEPMICTRDAEKLRRIQRQYRIAQAYTDYQQLLEAGPDLVMIHASTDSHYSLVKRALLAGIGVFVDKPICDNYPHSRELIELAQQQSVPLWVGFNRRFAPLYQPPLAHPARQVHYQKNRVDLPAPARSFVFDDFIHVLDFVLLCSPGEPEDLQVACIEEAGLLSSLQVQWRSQGALLVASMDRLAGRAEEQLRYVARNEHWQIESLSAGSHFSQGQQRPLGFGDWEPTLAKRGFVAMVEALLQGVERGQTPAEHERNLRVHRLCETVLESVPSAGRG